MALPGCRKQAERRLTAAETVFGGERHLKLAGVDGRGKPWPVPFDAACVLSRRGRPTAVLASGDPFWHGAGGSLAAHLVAGRMDRASRRPRPSRSPRRGWAGRSKTLSASGCMPRRSNGWCRCSRAARTSSVWSATPRRLAISRLAHRARLWRLAALDVVGARRPARVRDREQGGELRGRRRG